MANVWQLCVCVCTFIYTCVWIIYNTRATVAMATNHITLEFLFSLPSLLLLRLPLTLVSIVLPPPHFSFSHSAHAHSAKTKTTPSPVHRSPPPPLVICGTSNPNGFSSFSVRLSFLLFLKGRPSPAAATAVWMRNDSPFLMSSLLYAYTYTHVHVYDRTAPRARTRDTEIRLQYATTHTHINIGVPMYTKTTPESVDSVNPSGSTERWGAGGNLI